MTLSLSWLIVLSLALAVPAPAVEAGRPDEPSGDGSGILYGAAPPDA